VPFAYDQLVNALRVKKLGAGIWLKPKQCRARSLACAADYVEELAEGSQ
jgi:UDP:flavonoid glycosyltransferase YjiC (YdhE family)